MTDTLTKLGGEKVRKDSRRVGVKRELWGRSERCFISGGRKSIILLEGSQALHARPSDNGRMRVKTLGWE
jgi:hypothetical protein